ncbi:MAG: outer membrane protein OmpK [Pseudomonadota bacterium]|nr:outer membrane protein OmpK [Pseudomonadota bacterium]
MYPVRRAFGKWAQPFLLQVVAVLGGLGYAAGAWAGAAQWSATNIQYLYGDSYEAIFFNTGTGQLDSNAVSGSVITVEHVNGWKYGDNFFFVDLVNPDRRGGEIETSFYSEYSPRLSFGKMTGSDLSFGFIKDVLLSATMEVGDGFHNYLYGLGLDLNVPGMPVFQINFYARNEANTDTGNQITLVWFKPFAIGSLDFAFEGFLDYAFGLDPSEDNLITAPRLLVDVGKTWGAPGVLQAGVEYQIWRNKYGIDGIDEDVAQAMVKWIW